MKIKATAILLSVLGAGIAFLPACQSTSGRPSEAPVSADSLVRRGHYLVTTMGCNDCHSPKRMTAQGPVIDSTRILSGHPAGELLPPASADAIKNGWALFSPGGTAVVFPFGTVYAANLTPDDTGIGNWSEEQFKKALTRGLYKGMENGRPLFPPMPWENYKNLSDPDVKAIFAYLRSIPPVENVVPAPQTAAPSPQLSAADH